ncbi:Growth-regulating factor 11, partial [Linum grandiflorum]
SSRFCIYHEEISYQGREFNLTLVFFTFLAVAAQLFREEDQRRCRRTDGKKWRCRREVVSNEKYCDRHLHRGVRRRPEASSGDVPPPLPPATSNQLECCSKMLPGKDDNATTSSASSDATVSEVLLFN